jgi:hypothetical protein
MLDLTNEALANRLEWLAATPLTFPVAEREAVLHEAAERLRALRATDDEPKVK